jgi:hypothetical protein
VVVAACCMARHRASASVSRAESSGGEGVRGGGNVVDMSMTVGGAELLGFELERALIKTVCNTGCSPAG